MTEENLKWLENVFRRTVGENGEIRLQDFKNIVHSKNVRKLGLGSFFDALLKFFCSLFSLNGYSTFLTKMTMVAFHCKNSSMPCTNLLVKVQMTKSNSYSKSTTLTVNYFFFHQEPLFKQKPPLTCIISISTPRSLACWPFKSRGKNANKKALRIDLWYVCSDFSFLPRSHKF